MAACQHGASRIRERNYRANQARIVAKRADAPGNRCVDAGAGCFLE